MLTIPIGETMIVVSVMYPSFEGSKFDFDYYVSTHIPLVNKHWSDKGLKNVKLLKGLAGGGPGEAPSFQVVALLEFKSMEALQNCMGFGGDEIMADVANFTDVEPVLQISETFV